jgi:hypothetical protein
MATAALAAAGCGEDASRPPTATATETAAPAAGSGQECYELWNADARLGTAGQKTPADYLAELAPTPATVIFENGECLVLAPTRDGSPIAYVWVARGGRAPFGHPSRQRVGQLEFNARGRRDGRLEPA